MKVGWLRKVSQQGRRYGPRPLLHRVRRKVSHRRSPGAFLRRPSSATTRWEIRLVSELVKQSPYPADTTSCFLTPEHLCHHFITTSPWGKTPSAVSGQRFRRKDFCPLILLQTQTLHVFKATVGGKFEAMNLIDCDVDTLAGNIKEVLLSVVHEVRGSQRKKKQPWVYVTKIGS